MVPCQKVASVISLTHPACRNFITTDLPRPLTMNLAKPVRVSRAIVVFWAGQVDARLEACDLRFLSGQIGRGGGGQGGGQGKDEDGGLGQGQGFEGYFGRARAHRERSLKQVRGQSGVM